MDEMKEIEELFNHVCKMEVELFLKYGKAETNSYLIVGSNGKLGLVDLTNLVSTCNSKEDFYFRVGRVVKDVNPLASIMVSEGWVTSGDSIEYNSDGSMKMPSQCENRKEALQLVIVYYNRSGQSIGSDQWVNEIVRDEGKVSLAKLIVNDEDVNEILKEEKTDAYNRFEEETSSDENI